MVRSLAQCKSWLVAQGRGRQRQHDLLALLASRNLIHLLLQMPACSPAQPAGKRPWRVAQWRHPAAGSPARVQGEPGDKSV